MKEFFLVERGIYYRLNDFQNHRQTLVFVHGLTGSASAWWGYEKKFENKYNILTFDLRGHGKSDKPKQFRDYDIQNFVQDISDLVKYLQIDNFILISHSFGTAIALEFLMQWQEHIEAAIFLSPIFNVRTVKWVRVVHLLFGRLIKVIDSLAFSSKRGKHVDYSKYENTGDWNLRRMAADILNTSFHVYIYCLEQIYKFNGEQYLERISRPVLVIHGKKDSVMPVKNVVTSVRKIKQHKLVILEEANHIIVLNNISEVCRVIGSFITF